MGRPSRRWTPSTRRRTARVSPRVRRSARARVRCVTAATRTAVVPWWCSRTPSVKAFKNIVGVDTCNVNALNLLQLAPGGHVGRFIVWTKSAFEQLPKIFGGFDEKSETKKGYTLPRPTVALSDVQRVLASAEVKKACRDRKKNSKHVRRHTNPFRNTTALKRINPHAVVLKGQAKVAKKVAKKN